MASKDLWGPLSGERTETYGRWTGYIKGKPNGLTTNAQGHAACYRAVDDERTRQGHTSGLPPGTRSPTDSGEDESWDGRSTRRARLWRAIWLKRDSSPPICLPLEPIRRPAALPQRSADVPCRRPSGRSPVTNGTAARKPLDFLGSLSHPADLHFIAGGGTPRLHE